MFFLIQHFMGAPPSKARPAPAFATVFAGIDPAQGAPPTPATAPLTPATANAEVTKLQANIAANDSDDLARWSKMRLALIQQYVTGTLQTKTRKVGMFPLAQLGVSAPPFTHDQTYYPAYEDIYYADGTDSLGAQAMYQAGDLLWRQSLKDPSLGDSSVAVFENILVHERGNALLPGRARSFANLPIYVPTQVDPAKVPLTGPPPSGFHLVKIGDLKGTVAAPNPQGIADRMDAHYQPTFLYRVFDSFVRALGSNPLFSYGIAVLIFSVLLRSATQPIYKKQYDSMKGMAAIAPEMKKIQERYKGKTEQSAQMEQMKEIQELQRRHGVNPMLGCGLSVLQLPILFLLVYPTIQHYEPRMELVGAQFLWIGALARPDLLLLVLYAASMFLSMRLSATPAADESQRQQQQMMTRIFMFFPLLMSTYPAAFLMYWTTTNLLSTAFQWRLMKKADPSKNFWLALRGDGLNTVAATAGSDAVAPRPTGLNGNGAAKPVKVQTKTPSLNGTVDGQNRALDEKGAKNGAGGAHKSAPNGIVLGPSADEVERRKKKRK